MGQHKNTVLAIVLSLLVVVGWQFFIGYPQVERQRQQAEPCSRSSRRLSPARHSRTALSPECRQASALAVPSAAAPSGVAAGRIARRGDRVLAAHRRRDAAARRQHLAGGAAASTI